MSDYRTVDTVNSEQYYANEENIKPKKVISRPKKKSPFKRLTDKGKVIVSTLLVAGMLVAGAKGAQDIVDAKDRADVYEQFEATIKKTYEESEFLQSTFRIEDYTKYSEGVIKDALKEEKSLVTYLRKEGQKDEFDEKAWLYILSGEGNRENLQDKSILKALSEYLPHSEKVSFHEHKPDKRVSYFAQLGDACESEENKAEFISLFDAAIGGSSLSNSPEAINYRLEKIAEMKRYIEYGDKTALEGNIEINNNFDQNIKNNRSLLEPYFEKLYNPRIQAAEDIKNGEAFNNVRDPKALSKLTRGLLKYGIVEDPYIAIRDKGMVIEVALPEAYDMFRETRNDLYRKCVDAIDNPQKVEELNKEEAKLQEKLTVYKLYKEKDGKILEEIYFLVSERAELLDKLNKANKKIAKTGFDDFAR
ncbi:MAG: hypothetical protein E7314_02365 [Clostridiales bacterium]|nr:hypothetical protein [Clostridiales bacterium]